MDVRMDGRVAVITGASTGLGLAMAKEFAASGASVALLARKADALATAKAEVIKAAGKTNAKVEAYSCDVSKAQPIADTVKKVMADLGITDVCLASIAKGPDRNAGRERFFMPGREPFSLDPKSPVLYFLQRLRDEAHRFVIGAHRAKRSKEIRHSILDDVPGIGAKRKKALLLHFGSARAVSQAGLSDLSAVPGVSEAVARKIYDHFHGG